MDRADQQMSHRLARESEVIRANIISRYIAQASSTLIGLAGILGGVVLMYHGANGYGIAAFLSALVALVGTHLYATDSGRRERIEKSRILAGQPQIEETPEIERGGAAS